MDSFIGFLRQSTTITVNVGVFVDATDGVNEEVGLAPAMVVKLSKNGAVAAVRNSGTAITHDSGQDGHYLVELNTTDTNTLGLLKITVQDSTTHRPVALWGIVVGQNVWDAFCSTDKLQVDTREFAGDIASATAMGLGVPTNFKDLAITVTTGLVTAGTVSDKTGYSISGTLTTLDALKNFDPATETVDVGKIDGNAQAATNLKHAASSLVVFQATGGGHTATLINTNLTSSVNNIYVGRHVYGSISGALLGEGTTITGYNGTTKALTVDVLAQVPLDTQDMVIA